MIFHRYLIFYFVESIFFYFILTLTQILIIVYIKRELFFNDEYLT